MKKPGSLFCLLCIALTLAGCRTLRGGGAPDPSFDIEADLRALDEEFRTATNIKAYYSLTTRPRSWPRATASSWDASSRSTCATSPSSGR